MTDHISSQEASQNMIEENQILKMEGITKTFPGVKALDNVSFDARIGEIHALVGENGAGKSTLMKILSGEYLSESGSLYFKGQEMTIAILVTRIPFSPDPYNKRRHRFHDYLIQKNVPHPRNNFVVSIFLNHFPIHFVTGPFFF